MSTNAGYTNTDKNSNVTISVPNLKPVTNYARIEDEPTVAVVSNVTCPIDQGELLTYRCNEVDHVSTSQKVRNPAKVQDGIQYVVKLEDIFRTSLATGDIVDEPVVAYITIRHPRSSNITKDIVDSMFARLIGACYKADGTTRFNDLMRSALMPTTD